jgi:hypothetical protein
MSLSYDFTRVRDYDNVCLNAEDKISNLTYALIISTVSIGMNEITHQNAAQFYARIRTLERLTGPLLKDGTIKPVDIHAHIRLKTNATPLSLKKWAGNIVEDTVRTYTTEYHQRALPVEDDSEPGKGVISE